MELLVYKNMNKADLREVVGLASNAMTKLSGNGHVATEIMENLRHSRYVPLGYCVICKRAVAKIMLDM